MNSQNFLMQNSKLAIQWDDCEFTNLHLKNNDLEGNISFSRLTNIESSDNHFKKFQLAGCNVDKLLFENDNFNDCKFDHLDNKSHFEFFQSSVHGLEINHSSLNNFKICDTKLGSIRVLDTEIKQTQLLNIPLKGPTMPYGNDYYQTYIQFEDMNVNSIDITNSQIDGGLWFKNSTIKQNPTIWASDINSLWFNDCDVIQPLSSPLTKAQSLRIVNSRLADLKIEGQDVDLLTHHYGQNLQYNNNDISGNCEISAEIFAHIFNTVGKNEYPHNMKITWPAGNDGDKLIKHLTAQINWQEDKTLIDRFSNNDIIRLKTLFDAKWVGDKDTLAKVRVLKERFEAL